MRIPSPLLKLVSVIGLALLPLTASAANYTWIGGTNEWNTTSLLWNGSTVAWPGTGTDNAAIFDGTGGTVYIYSAVTANQLTFNSVGYNVTFGSLTLNGSAPKIITNQMATLSSNLAGTNGFTWEGANVLVLSGTNSGLSGTVNVNGTNQQLIIARTFSASNNATWNLGSSTAILAYNSVGGDGGTAQTVELGALSGVDGSVLRVGGSANPYVGTFKIGALNTNTTFAGHITNATFDNFPTTAITKTGTGSLTLSGDSVHTGITTVSRGTLIAGSDAVATTIARAAVTSVDAGTNTINYTNSLTNGDRVIFTNVSGGSLPGGLLANTTYYVINRTGSSFQVSTTPGGSVFDLTSTGANVLVSEAGAFGSTNSAIVVGDAETGSNAVALLIDGNHTIERAITVNNFGTGTTLGGNTDHNSYFTGNITLGKTANLQSITTGANSVTFSGILSGANGVTKTGSGTVTLGGANTFTGVTTLNQGILSVGTIGNGGVAGNLGQASNAASNLVFNGGTLRYTGATATSDRAFTIQNGVTAILEISANNLSIAGATGAATTGGLTKTGAGTLTLTGANTYTGLTTVSAGTLAYGVNNAISTGGITVNGGTLALGNFSDTVGAVTLTSGSITGTGGVLTGTSYAVADGSVSAILAGSGAVTKSTGGSVTFSAANTYTGSTLVSEGTLILSGSGSIAGSTTVDVASGAILDHSGVSSGTYTFVNGQTLQGTGTIIGDSVVNGNLRPGNSPGVLSFTGDLTLGDTANSTFEIQDTGMGRGTDYDGLNVSGVLAYDGTLSLSLTTLIADGTYDLFAFGGFDTLSNFNSVAFTGGPYAGTFTFNAGFWTAVDTNGSGQVFSFGLANGDLIVSAIPEPSTALLLTTGLMTLLFLRRRRNFSLS